MEKTSSKLAAAVRAVGQAVMAPTPAQVTAAGQQVLGSKPVALGRALANIATTASGVGGVVVGAALTVAAPAVAVAAQATSIETVGAAVGGLVFTVSAVLVAGQGQIERACAAVNPPPPATGRAQGQPPVGDPGNSGQP